MKILTDEQLNTLNKDALMIMFSALQAQYASMEEKLAENNRQIEILTEQLKLMNQRFFGKKSEANLNEIEGQISLFDAFNEAEYLEDPSASEPEITEVIISSYKRSKTKGKRDIDLDGLPARIIDHKLSAEQLGYSV